MLRLFLFLILILVANSASAQWRIPPLNPKMSAPPTHVFADDDNRDTLSISPSDEWERFTNIMGIGKVMGVFVNLPDPGFPYKLINWQVPFFGGSAESNQLAEAGVAATVWESPSNLSDVVPDSAFASTSAVNMKVAGYEVGWATFNFSGTPFWIGPRNVALGIRYNSGPDSMAVSPIWTSAPRTNRYFYGLEVQDSDTTTVYVNFEHDEFWTLFDIDPSVFGEMAGFLVVELDTAKADNTPEGESPVGTGLHEVWHLPNSHTVVDNFPNPFNPETTIRVLAQGSGRHEMQIYDVLGRVVYQTEFLGRSGERHEIRWNAHGLPSGAYWVSVKFDIKRWIHAMTLLK